MTYLVYYVIVWIIMFFCAKRGLELPDNDFMIIVAILTAGEVVSWRCKK